MVAAPAHAVLASLRDALEDPQTQQNGFRVLAVAATFLLLETFLIVGPTSGLIHRVFRVEERLHPKKAKRLVSQLAARLVGVLFLAAAMPQALKTLQEGSLKADKLYATSDSSTLCITVTAGYFVYDVFICTLRFHENGLAYLIHALGCCTVYLYAALSGRLHFYGAAFLMWELSTPFVYMRWVLLKLGLAESRLLTINNMAGFLVFLCCRNIYGPVMSWDFFQTSAADLANPRPGGFQPGALYTFRVICLALNGLNYFWLSQMLRLALGKPKHSKQS